MSENPPEPPEDAVSPGEADHSADPESVTAGGTPAPIHPQLSLLALASLLLGLLGLATLLLLFIGLIPAVAGLICGHLALIRIRHSRVPLRGRPAAIIGLVTGYLTVFLTPLIAIILVVAIPHLDEYFRQGQEAARLDHASELFRACENFARDHEDDYPTDWDELRNRYLSPRELDRLLSNQNESLWSSLKNRFTGDGDAEEISGPAFILVPHERPVLRELEGSVIVIREIAPTNVERIVVAYDNGNTTMIANPNRG